jgi:hypothetical protein
MPTGGELRRSRAVAPGLGAAVAALLCCAVGCGGKIELPAQALEEGGGAAPSAGGAGPGGAAPSITAFAAAPSSLAPGGTSTLTWTVSDATALAIDHGVGDVTGKTSVNLAPTATTTYTLTATGPGGTRTATATVTVASAQPAPAIASFTASPGQISSGGTATLTWTVSDATALAIDQGVGDVTGKTSVNVTPTATTAYILTATGPGGTKTATATVTVTSAQPAPAIASFTASPGQISSGGTATLAWSVSNATTLAIDQGVGDVTGKTSVNVTPTATTTYTLTASGAGGTRTATASVTVDSGGTADATLAIDTTQGRRAISPYVYGYNPPNAGRGTWTPSGTSAPPPGTTIWRHGGNRTTAYNWASNYSNAGADWGPYSSDTFSGSPSDGPGHGMVPLIDYAKSNGLAALVTVPIQGWVAKDASGNVSLSSALADHFIPNKPRKGSAFTTAPSATSAEVYQDELAAFVAQRVGQGREIHLSLDNEPDLWFGTHKEVERSQVTYASYLSRYLDSASALRDAVPGALLYGPASFGWWGYVNFSGAPDAPSNTGPDYMFLDWFLAQVKQASSQQGKKLLDVLDLHFYSEARSSGCASSGDNDVRVITYSGEANYAKRNLDCVVAARVQSARSLGDTAYVESSNVTRDSTRWSALGQAIQLLPRIQAKIAAGYAGTKLAITEYNFGGGDHVSGTIAQAEALGMLGREGAYGAMVWETLDDSSFIRGAFKHFRDYDGAGKSFGDTSVPATSTDADHLGVYASVDAASDGRLVLVIVHRPTLSGGSLDLRSRSVKITWTHSRVLTQARGWQTTSSSATPQPLPTPAVSGSSVTLTLPGMSVTTLELTP